jgi:hypothetical protein
MTDIHWKRSHLTSTGMQKHRLWRVIGEFSLSFVVYGNTTGYRQRDTRGSANVQAFSIPMAKWFDQSPVNWHNDILHSINLINWQEIPFHFGKRHDRHDPVSAASRNKMAEFRPWWHSGPWPTIVTAHHRTLLCGTNFGFPAPSLLP